MGALLHERVVSAAGQLTPARPLTYTRTRLELVCFTPHSSPQVLTVVLRFFLDEITAHSEVCGSRGFLEDRMMDIITGRAPSPAQAESNLSKGSQELARPGPSLLEALGLLQSTIAKTKTTGLFVPNVQLLEAFDVDLHRPTDMDCRLNSLCTARAPYPPTRLSFTGLCTNVPKPLAPRA